MPTTADALVGREAEVELLAASLEAAAQGQPRFVLIAGEAGIGKTRLLREAADIGVPLGLRVLSGTAIESGRAMPYLPLLAPLAECIEGRSDAHTDVVRRLVTGEPTSARSDGPAAAHVIESIFAVVAREPTLLLVDDVHWADNSTVGVLDYLSHRTRSESLTVIVAARDDETDGLASLPIADGRRFARVTVGRLPRQNVAEQLEALLGRVPEPDLVSVVFERSAGNPFFVEQLLASDGEAPPASLRTLVLGRLAELPERGRRAVEALAIIGRPAGEALLAAVAGIEEMDTSEGLREAARRGVTSPADEGFGFRHPLFAEVVLGDLSGSARRRLHRDAAVALVAGGADPAEIATHWWEAGDAEHAWAAALEAAERAEGALAFAEARLHLERALELWPTGVAGRPECLLRAAEAAFLAGHGATAVALAQRGLAEGAADEAELQIAIGRYAADAFEFAVSNEAFERAAAIVRADASGTTRAFALWGLARVRINQGRYTEARAAAEEAVKIAHDAGDPNAEAAGRFARGMTHALEGSLAGIADLERGVALAVQARSSAGTGAGHQFLSLLLHLAGEVDRALDVALAGIDACDALGVARTHSSDLRARAALIQHELGRWDEADAILEPAEPRALPLLASALLAMRRGHFDIAELRLDRATPGRGAIGVTANGLSLARVELAWLRADPAVAWAILDAMPEEPGLWGASTAAEAARLAARLAADDPRSEAPPATQVQHPDPRLDAALQVEIGAETARGAGIADPQLWAACTRAWTAARRPYDRTYARLREAEALFAVDTRGPAREALREAAAAASELGARPLRALADELARRARVSPEPPRPRESNRDEPTPRELDVLVLLAEGLTNREIAARLFLSPKTVGIHVSRLHQKLDAHTRGEAVAVARRRGILV